MNEHTFIVHPENAEQENVLKAFFKALKIKFEVANESDYNSDFVNMILDADKQIKDGKGKKVSSQEFDLLCK
jgi:hypothetical protein